MIHSRLCATWVRAPESAAFGGVVQRHRDYLETRNLHKTVVLILHSDWLFPVSVASLHEKVRLTLSASRA